MRTVIIWYLYPLLSSYSSGMDTIAPTLHLAREEALVGNYESALIHFDSVLQLLQR